MSLSSQIVFFVFFIDEELRLVLSKFTHLLSILVSARTNRIY